MTTASILTSPVIFIMNAPYDPIRPGDVGVIVERIKEQPATEEDLGAWCEYLSKWKIAGPLPIVVMARRNGTIIIQFEMQVNDSRNHLDPTSTMFIYVTSVAPSMRPDITTARWLRAMMRWMFCHELDEYIKVDGVLAFDPHHPDRPPPTPENS